MKGKLISALEEEMGFLQRTTCRQLNNMNDVELNTNFTKTKAMHKLLWEIKQRDVISDLDMKALLAAFQEDERERFKSNTALLGLVTK